jgi:hypothetical protein
MAVLSNRGTSVALSEGVPASQDQIGYEALAFTPLSDVTSGGSLGIEFTEIEHNPIGNEQTQYFKGSFNYGQLTLDGARNLSDAGQILLETAGADVTEALYAFKITYQDGSNEYFQGQIFSFKSAVGGADSLVTFNAPVRVNTAIVRVEA